MSGTRSFRLDQVEVATAIMTVLGPIVGGIIGVLLDHWWKNRRCRNSQQHDLEGQLSLPPKGERTIDSRLQSLETSFEIILTLLSRQADQKIKPVLVDDGAHEPSGS